MALSPGRLGHFWGGLILTVWGGAIVVRAVLRGLGGGAHGAGQLAGAALGLVLLGIGGSWLRAWHAQRGAGAARDGGGGGRKGG